MTQESDQFGSSEKLLVTVQTENGASYTFRTGLNSWTASSLLSCFRRMSRDQIAEKIEITLTPRSRTVFASVSTLQPDGSYKRVELSQDELGTKLSYDEMLDCLSHMNGADEVSTLDQLWHSSSADDADSFVEVEPAPTAAEAELDAAIAAAKADHAPVPQAKIAAKFTAKRKQSRRVKAKAKAATGEGSIS